MYRKRNEKIDYAGKSLSLSEWAKELGIKRQTLWQRLYKYNLTVDEALSNGKYLQKQKGRKITWGEKISEAKKGKAPYKMTDEIRKKIGRKGELNKKYIKDRTKLKEGRKHAFSYRYKDWMKNVKNRDLWVCQLKSENCSGRLEAHHIMPWSQSPELRYEVNNGISLCHYHHPKKREEEQRLAPVFQEMVLRPVYEQAVNI